MNIKSINWDEIPNVITKEQFRILCHISKSTARYLLLSGKVPCLNTGRKTRCYKILKKDVMEYIEAREESPEYYMAESGWYANKSKLNISMSSPSRIYKDMRDYYNYLLHSYPDVLNTKEISEITGYVNKTVNSWCHNELLRSFMVMGQHKVPKVYLIDFFCSPYFRTIVRKSKWHIKILNAYPRWKYRNKA